MADSYIAYDGPIVTFSEARSLGLKKYFSGRVCINGHLSERSVSKRHCCECYKIILANYRSKNREALREYQRTHYKKLCDEAPDAVLQKSRSYRENNREKVRANTAKHRAKDPEKFRLLSRQWHDQHPDSRRNACRRRRAAKRQAGGTFTVDKVNAIRNAQKDRCAYCRKRLAGGGHLDHIQPLAKGGNNWPKNLQWLCEPCNKSKGATDPIVWANKIGLLI